MCDFLCRGSPPEILRSSAEDSPAGEHIGNEAAARQITCAAARRVNKQAQATSLIRLVVTAARAPPALETGDQLTVLCIRYRRGARHYRSVGVRVVRRTAEPAPKSGRETQDTEPDRYLARDQPSYGESGALREPVQPRLGSQLQISVYASWSTVTLHGCIN